MLAILAVWCLEGVVPAPDLVIAELQGRARARQKLPEASFRDGVMAITRISSNRSLYPTATPACGSLEGRASAHEIELGDDALAATSAEPYLSSDGVEA
jgi:hypothetical protein